MGVSALQVSDKSQIAAIARMFSAGVIRELAQAGESPMLSRLIDESGLHQSLAPTSTLHEVFDTAFNILKRKDFRHEYVYKAAITNKILLGRHSLQTAAMITEFRVSTCKADVVMLNGTSTAYEIKSERDRLDRLPAQIDSFRKMFANVCVVVGANHVDAVLAVVPQDVGLIALSDRFQLSTIREPTDRTDNVSQEVIFDSLRLNESKQVLQQLNVAVPDVPNTLLYNELKKRFLSLKSRELHDAMLNVLKSSRSLCNWNAHAANIPQSLNAAIFSAQIRKADYQRLVHSFRITLDAAAKWV